MPLVDSPQLGRLQQAILILLWNDEMYGLEIQRRLKFQGLKVVVGQLYPALKKLEDRGWIGSREEARVGATRKYYRISREGMQALVDSWMHMLYFFQYIAVQRINPIFEEAAEALGIEPGDVVADLSTPHIEKLRMKVASRTQPGGRYIVLSAYEDFMDALKEWVSYEELGGLVEIVDREELQRIPDRLVDKVLILYNLHDKELDWMISETARILKPGGRAVISDVAARIGATVRDELYEEFMPEHSRSGIDESILGPELGRRRLRVTDRWEKKGVVTLLLESEPVAQAR